ncbi:MAG TPA: acyl-CoA dehydrogenase family protein [Solirubrobacteraceae bacterium]|nr:acyl-CoA dehydrogenase family protein [Solirubrobacteraceae bacterium]
MAEVLARDSAAVLAAVREVARDRIAPAAAEVDRDARFPEDGLQALSDAGALGLLIPPEHGGAGAGLSTLAEACETIAGACASTGMVDLETRSARALVRRAARLGDAGDESALVVVMEAKVGATDTGPRVTQQALEVCGGQGYTPGLPIERHLRDARAGAVMAPTNAVPRTWIGKALAGLPVP